MHVSIKSIRFRTSIFLLLCAAFFVACGLSDAQRRGLFHENRQAVLAKLKPSKSLAGIEGFLAADFYFLDLRPYERGEIRERPMPIKYRRGDLMSLRQIEKSTSIPEVIRSLENGTGFAEEAFSLKPNISMVTVIELRGDASGPGVEFRFDESANRWLIQSIRYQLRGRTEE